MKSWHAVDTVTVFAILQVQWLLLIRQAGQNAVLGTASGLPSFTRVCVIRAGFTSECAVILMGDC